jgi:hypothetical protein
VNQIDLSVFEKQSNKFTAFIHEKDNDSNTLDFKDEGKLLGKEEGYKAKIPGKAQTILNVSEWDESWIGSGRIAERIIKAMEIGANLVNFNGKINFNNHFDKSKKEYNPDAERAIYKIFKEDNDKASFEYAVKVFGAKYSTLAYLFFIKDDTKYLPTSPQGFDRAFKELGINLTLTFNCSWDNYCDFVNTIREIRKLMPRYLDVSHEIRLLDAHSFIWMMGEEKYMNWSFEPQDINTPLVPKNIINELDGTVRFQCARCDYVFLKAPRCPECGQAVKE